MYLSKITIENFRCFGDGADRFELPLRPGLTALVGENDAGKTAVIDAVRFALGTTDQEWYRLEDSDFRGDATSREIRIICKFQGLTPQDKRAFVEYLTYDEKSEDDQVLYVDWTAEDTGEIRKGNQYRRVEVHSGKDGDGPSIPTEVRDLLRATYLRPLRDAEQALSAGRGSRLAQVLRHSDQIKKGTDIYTPDIPLEELSVLGIGNLVNALLEKQQGVLGVRKEIDTKLKGLSLRGERLTSDIQVSGMTASNDIRLRELLEKLDLCLGGAGKLGLGSNNLLFMACELLLLSRENDGSSLLLIEEPEGHLHAQRQLRVMKFMQEQASEKDIQIIVTTHSPNLASAIELNNLVMIRNGRAFSMAAGQTELESSDYRFLKRFLDVTKANLFFARAVMIVEGDAENILLPALATLIGRDFTEHGVSIVNVGGVGLRRYARIFQRKDVKKDGQLNIRIACVTDLDIMPNCAGEITGKSLPTKAEFSQPELAEKKTVLRKKTSGQMVETFVSDEWTLEYDLAFSGLAEDVYVAACLAKKDAALAKKGEDFDNKKVEARKKAALKAFENIKQRAVEVVETGNANGCSRNEVLASLVYALFTKGTTASKAIAAQYLAERLQCKNMNGELTSDVLRSQLPTYLAKAIDYVTDA